MLLQEESNFVPNDLPSARVIKLGFIPTPELGTLKEPPVMVGLICEHLGFELVANVGPMETDVSEFSCIGLMAESWSLSACFLFSISVRC